LKYLVHHTYGNAEYDSNLVATKEQAEQAMMALAQQVLTERPKTSVISQSIDRIELSTAVNLPRTDESGNVAFYPGAMRSVFEVREAPDA
jgi:hypothetical protein